MKRYKKANEGIHAPWEVKEKAVRPAGRRGYPRWAGAVAAVLAVVLIGGAAMWPGRTNPNEPAPLSENGPGPRSVPAPMGRALAAAQYPEMAPLPLQEDYTDASGKLDWDGYDQAYGEWEAGMAALRSDEDYAGVMDGFLTKSTAQFLTGAGKKNRVYSPLNVYMALSMLAETTGGESRRQILELLQVDSVEDLRARAAALWRDHYRDDGVGASILANSLWLRDDMAYNQDTLDTLAAEYYASSFAGEMGTAEYTQALREWINEQTNGLLAEQADGLELDADTVLALASTIYFKAAWDSGFNAEATQEDVFYAPGGKVKTDFMRQTMKGGYYWGEHFTAARLMFQDGGGMWLLLPDKGYSVDKLLKSGEAMEFLLCDKKALDEDSLEQGKIAGGKTMDIHLSMPKFDVSSDLDLTEGLKELGVTDVFDWTVSNFDPLGAGTDDALAVGQIQHAARVKVDEEGCEAAAYTVILVCGTAFIPPNEEVEFTLDRPFLFAITGDSGLPLFTGVVNQPNG